MEFRKSIDELIALHSLESEIKDIYVEGGTDKALLEWFLISHNVIDVKVYIIDTIEIDKLILDRHGLHTGSKRSRVLALSQELALNLTGDHKILCIVDRDNEDYLPSGINNQFIQFTDYNSTELYLMRISTFRKLFSLVLGGFTISPEEAIFQIQGALEDVYIIRAVNEALGWSMQWIPFTKYVNIAYEISFDNLRFVKAYLQKNDKWNEREQFDAMCGKLRSRLKADPRLRIRGHDLIELLFFMVKKLRKSRRFGNIATFQGAFMGCIELQEISEENMFQRILCL